MAGQLLNPNLLLAVPLAPLAGAVIAGLFGTKFFGNLVGRKTSHTVTILGVLIALILSVHDLDGRARRRHLQWHHLPTG